MTTAINEEVVKTEQLMKTLYGHIRAFERAQAVVGKRFQDIKQGNLPPNRIPTADLVKRRQQARNGFREFLNGLSQEEKSILTIAHGASWKSEYEELLNPAKDPKFE